MLDMLEGRKSDAKGKAALAKAAAALAKAVAKAGADVAAVPPAAVAKGKGKGSRNDGKNDGKEKGLHKVTADSKPICFRYNSGSPCEAPCGRVHGCQICLGPHPKAVHGKTPS
mgnify:CR=1 FL=1